MMLRIIFILFLFSLPACSSKIYLNQPYDKTKEDMKVYFDDYNKKIHLETEAERKRLLEIQKKKKLEKPAETNTDKSPTELERLLSLTSNHRRVDTSKLVFLKRKKNDALFREKSNKESYWFVNYGSPMVKIDILLPRYLLVTIKAKGKRRSKIIIDSFKQGMLFKERYYGDQTDWANAILKFLKQRQK